MDFNKNYYSTLGIDKNASQDQIKKAYRKLAKEHHPDATQNHDDSKFKEINEAFSVVGNEEEKQKYDVQSPHGKNYQHGFGNGFFRMNINGQDFNPFGGGSPFGFGDIDDAFFNNIFRRKEEFVENLDIHMGINITLKDIYNNVNIPIKFKHDIKCDVCNHTGFDPTSDSYECDACDGKGSDGFTKCRFCGGTGKIHTGTCTKCNGNKVISKEEEFGFTNTYSIDKGFVKYMRGLGHQSRYYTNKIGTLVINANYVPDNRYSKEGNNLIFPLNLHYQHAIDGIDFEYEHLDDKKYALKIPPKTKDGDLLRVNGKGLLINQQQRGDLIIRINVIIDYDLLK
jgi:molecular chaperone DnaJ